MTWRCDNCGYETSTPVNGVNAHYERSHLWCMLCAPIRFRDGQPELSEFPAQGKLIPESILTESEEIEK